MSRVAAATVLLLLMIAAACRQATPPRNAEKETYERLMAWTRAHPRTMTWTPADRATVHRLLRAYTDLSEHPDRHHAARTYLMLFMFLRHDPKADPKEVLFAAHGVEQFASFPESGFVQPARYLAERGLDLDYAEHLARRGVVETHRYFNQHPAEATPPEFVDTMVARAHEALGMVLHRRGRDGEAEQELVAAGRTDPSAPALLHRVASFYEQRRDPGSAAEWYAWAALASDADRGDAKRAYAAAHGSLAGYDELVARIGREDEARRRKGVLARRAAAPPPAPPFRFKTLDGRTASLDDFRGRVAVINFWTTWCDWCAREMPELQRLHRRHANDPKVSIATVDVGESEALVRKWLAQNHYDLPVMLGTDSFAKQAGVESYPTTWFLDPGGRIAFTKVGGTRHLEQEFTWRIAALLDR